MDYYFKEEKICPKCEKTYDELPLHSRYCPECGSELRNKLYFEVLERITNGHKPYTRKYCRDCGAEFETAYKFCPLCSRELVEEEIFNINMEEVVVEGKWNESIIKISFDDIYDYHPYIDPIKPFKLKSFFDKKFEEDIYSLGLPRHHIKPIEKLEYAQVKDCISKTININEEDYHFVIKYIDDKDYLFDKMDCEIIGTTEIGELYLVFGTVKEIKLKLNRFFYIWL